MGIRVRRKAAIAGPLVQGAQDDRKMVIVGFNDRAQKRQEVAAQKLKSELIARTIISKYQYKVLFKLVIEKNCVKRSSRIDPTWASWGMNEPNQIVHDDILSSNIDLIVNYNTKIPIRSLSSTYALRYWSAPSVCLSSLY
ncbi:MAG: hypothetical protein JAZ19_18830 [Candidatus Thiodiazotropha taylori]|nr:hypothetical protein [Candidatus Thiodiazotropha taylori]